MFIRKLFTVYVIFSFLLTSCAGQSGGLSKTRVGPQPSSTLGHEKGQDIDKEQNLEISFQKLDIIVPVFEPGLPEDPASYEKEGVWPELRRAEANRFAWKLKEALEKTGRFGAVRVTPDSEATGDLYILGEIIESNGEEVEIDVLVMDISGREWLDESYDHEVREDFHQDLRNDGKDPYAPLFTAVTSDIIEKLKTYDNKELADLHYLADLRFGANFSDAAFGQYMQESRGKISLIAKPSEDDPMYQRIKALRVRDQLFIDSMQANYTAFSEQMDESYKMWQEQSLIEAQAERAASRATWGKAIGGVLLIGLAVLSGVAGARSDSSGGTAAGATGAIIGGMAGSQMIKESFKTSEEAEMHRDAINELGQSLDMELAPQVIAFEKETVELTGDAKEQFDQWRDFLQKMYTQEMTPDVQL
jgi:hypothetical protein